MTVTIGTIDEVAKLRNTKRARNVRAAATYWSLAEKGCKGVSESKIDELIATNSTNLFHHLKDKKTSRPKYRRIAQ
jgi:phosphoribosylpyrophosphate synthetase